MQNKLLLALLALCILALCPQTALGDGIIVDNASAVWNLTLDDATEVDHLVGEPGVFVTKYADTFSYFTLENATAIGRLIGEPGVFVTKYADAFVYYSLEDALDVQHLVGEPGVMVTKYADAFVYQGLEVPPIGTNVTGPILSNVSVTNITLTSATVIWDTDEVADSLVKCGIESETYTVQDYDPTNVTAHSVNLIGLLSNTTYYFVVNSTNMNGNSSESEEYTFSTTIGAEYFDTCEGTYPSIGGTYNGTIKPSSSINVSTLYTYPCAGTGGHTESIELYENDTLIASGVWEGYLGDWHNITFDAPFTLYAGTTYNYTIETGSYPQVVHVASKVVTGGIITCSEFTDANGVVHYDWIPAITLE
jgi:hypothetical protein